jgi:signal transduction histidine kinase
MDRGEIMTIDVPAPGDAVLHEAKLVPEFGVDGITTSLLLIARDVTERRRAEEEHRRQREILDSVIRAVPGPIIVIGGDPPRVYLSNPAFRKLTPHPELDPNGRTLVELFESGDHLPRRLEETRQLLREGKPGAGSLTLDCGGIRRVFDYQTLPMVWLGEPALVAVLWDITRLQELTEQRDDLLRTISHDIRTPLNTMLLHAQIIAELAGPESPLTRRADSILTSGRQVARMISDMVDVARLESGTLELELEPVDFAAYVAELLERLAGTLDMDRVRLETEARLAPVVLDPRRFERVLVNLISNALKYSSDEVVVRICPRAPHVALEVLDRGVGIVPEDQPKIFQRYYRSGTPSAREGLGLGLYIVTMLVQAHGGKIELESEPGEGSVFRVLLPLQPALSSE